MSPVYQSPCILRLPFCDEPGYSISHPSVWSPEPPVAPQTELRPGRAALHDMPSHTEPRMSFAMALQPITRHLPQQQDFPALLSPQPPGPGSHHRSPPFPSIDTPRNGAVTARAETLTQMARADAAGRSAVGEHAMPEQFPARDPALQGCTQPSTSPSPGPPAPRPQGALKTQE